MGQDAVVRELRFEKLADIHMELDRLEHAQTQGLLASTGSWTSGQIFGHLAYWINGAYYGLPIKTPWIVRVLPTSAL